MSLVGSLVTVAAIQAAAIVALLVHRARRSRAERALRENEERFRLLADRAPVIVWTARPDTMLDYVNSTCVEFTGRSRDQLLNEGWLDIVHPEDVDRCQSSYIPAFEARLPFLLEYRVRCADSSYRWLLASGVPKHEPDGSFAGYIGCDIDITERKNAEDQIRESQTELAASHREIQDLAGRLIEAQDAERARIARDLHDDVSQRLAGVSISFSRLNHRLAEYRIAEDLQRDVLDLQQQMLTLAKGVRQLSHDLHPTVLRHVGLVRALTSYCAELERAHGVVMRCSAEGSYDLLAPEAALCVYRIAQEALRNVIAHAGARRADVRVVDTGDHVEITITDDGRGFDVASSLVRSKGLGLVSLTERAKIAGGTISIESALKEGTRVRASIPARAAAKSDAGSEVEGQMA